MRDGRRVGRDWRQAPDSWGEGDELAHGPHCDDHGCEKHRALRIQTVRVRLPDRGVNGLRNFATVELRPGSDSPRDDRRDAGRRRRRRPDRERGRRHRFGSRDLHPREELVHIRCGLADRGEGARTGQCPRQKRLGVFPAVGGPLSEPKAPAQATKRAAIERRGSASIFSRSPRRRPDGL